MKKTNKDWMDSVAIWFSIGLLIALLLIITFWHPDVEAIGQYIHSVIYD